VAQPLRAGASTFALKQSYGGQVPPEAGKLRRSWNWTWRAIRRLPDMPALQKPSQN